MLRTTIGSGGSRRLTSVQERLCFVGCEFGGLRVSTESWSVIGVDGHCLGDCTARRKHLMRVPRDAGTVLLLGGSVDDSWQR